MTGPAALYATAQHYRRMFPDANDVTILDSSKIFPFSWSKTNMALNRICNGKALSLFYISIAFVE